MAEVTIDEAACTSCERCVEICPVDVLRPHATTGRAMVAYPDDCCGCHLCAEECPADCITIDDMRNTEGISMYDKLGLIDRWDA
jgi:NAD-dependent dihydropyrimidine dehydrogenase PreA subunit